jgi:hypothetical protein
MHLMDEVRCIILKREYGEKVFLTQVFAALKFQTEV